MACAIPSLYDAQGWGDQPVPAADVQFHLNRMLETGQPRPRVGVLRRYIERTEVVEAKTVRVHTKFPRPAAMLPWLVMDYTVIYPKHVLETGVDFDDRSTSWALCPSGSRATSGGRVGSGSRTPTTSKRACRSWTAFRSSSSATPPGRLPPFRPSRC
jgi:hypothetical protein